MTKEEHVNYWLVGAAHDLDAAESLFASEKYDWCLFIGHLVLEKTLKALYVYRIEDELPPKIHNLLRLAELASIPLTEEQQEFLGQVNTFQIESRYPEYRQEFYQRCTKAYAEPYFTHIKELYVWLKSLMS